MKHIHTYLHTHIHIHTSIYGRLRQRHTERERELSCAWPNLNSFIFLSQHELSILSASFFFLNFSGVLFSPGGGGGGTGLVALCVYVYAGNIRTHIQYIRMDIHM